jgi:hypothetical protein
MFAVPFDLDTLETRGTAVPVLDDVAFDAAAGLAQFDVSRDGTLVYRRGSGSGRAPVSFRWLDATGRQEPLQAKPGAYSFPSLSPDATGSRWWSRKEAAGTFGCTTRSATR